ncbi:MAG: exodeoxyribonuclease VII large subunit [Spirochaetes bacterium]|uniref:Exodeoxyribonuclease 7 large subunit n=1 Tax=Candidatus Gallitreponema excrementavium TaxID=2840840 RepID=A0A9D9HNK9_9SPIR|nr:exodeoxyribonuclease VII large subunit [Candidatus Gallitreponema excrementavium]
MDKKSLTVTEITGFIKTILEESFTEVRVTGEISNFRPSSTGHWYFTMKDKDAAISAVMFKNRINGIKFTPKDGEKVTVEGSLSVYPQRGSYQIICEKIEPAGEGDILARLEELKQKLYKEGLFDENRKRPLPLYPETIAVITSPTGAAIRDILQITRRRNPSVSVNILPSKVQGEDAPEDLIRQLKTANKFKLGEVIIIGRGGGSLEDLLPFSDENLVRAIASSEIPVVSAVGHEIDWALSDFAADKRAPTPSAAAEITVPEKSRIDALVNDLEKNLLDEITNRIEKIKLKAAQFKIENIENRFYKILQPFLLRFDDLKENLFSTMVSKVELYRQEARILRTKLEERNPLEILKRGFSIVRDKETGKILRFRNDISGGQKLSILNSEATYTAVVESIENKSPVTDNSL